MCLAIDRNFFGHSGPDVDVKVAVPPSPRDFVEVAIEVHSQAKLIEYQEEVDL